MPASAAPQHRACGDGAALAASRLQINSAVSCVRVSACCCMPPAIHHWLRAASVHRPERSRQTSPSSITAHAANPTRCSPQPAADRQAITGYVGRQPPINQRPPVANSVRWSPARYSARLMNLLRDPRVPNSIRSLSQRKAATSTGQSIWSVNDHVVIRRHRVQQRKWMCGTAQGRNDGLGNYPKIITRRNVE